METNLSPKTPYKEKIHAATIAKQIATLASNTNTINNAQNGFSTIVDIQ